MKVLLRLAVPSMIAMFFHTAFNFVDRLFVSRLGALPLGAIGMAFIVQSLLIAVGSGVGVGVSSLIARNIGAKRYDDANRAGEHAILIILFFSVLFTVCGPLLTRPLFILLGASEKMQPYILRYINIILLGSGFVFFSMIGGGILRGEGNMLTPMKVMMTGTLINLILDPLLIFGIGPFPALGVEGAALATVIGRGCSAVVLAFSLFSRRNIVKLSPKTFRFDPSCLKGIFSVGGPGIIAQLSMSLNLSLMFVILRPFGDAVKTAFTMYFTYAQLAFLPIIGVAGGVLTMAGQNLGGGKFSRLRTIATKSLSFSTVMMLGCAAVFIAGSGLFARVFSREADVVAYGRSLLIIGSIGLPFVAARFILANFLQGIGRGVSALLVNLVQMILFSVPLAWVMSRFLGVTGVWTGMTVGNCLGTIFGFVLVMVVTGRLRAGAESASDLQA